MGKELEMPRDALAVRLGAARDVQLDSLEFHLDILIFLPGKIYSIQVKENRVRNVRLPLRVCSTRATYKT